ncbi:MAG: hypothetical protein AB7J13_01675 [Pyrinomonadaceae bacterium]
MKVCPACQTQYSDDTLLFCLQDGTPLTSAVRGDAPTEILGEIETRVRPAASSGGSDPRVNGQVPVRPGRIVIAVGVTALIMLMIFGLVGIAAYTLWPEDTGAGVANTSAPNRSANGSPNEPPRSTPSPTPEATAYPAPSPSAAATGETTPFPRDQSDIKDAISQTVYGWKSKLESRNLNAYMSYYDSTVDYFRRRRVSSATVRADKARAFELYDSMRVNISNVSITVDRSGDAARATFDKEWSFSGRGTSEGKVRGELRFRRINGTWLITSERDLKVYFTR